MHESELRRILRGEGRGDRRWPPGREGRIRWQQVAEYRRRVVNDAQELFRWRIDLHVAANEGGAEATHERQKVFAPVPLARECKEVDIYSLGVLCVQRGHLEGWF
jgi:hypothetical protein